MPTKVHIVKAMVFPVVMYGCESWTIKKAERRRNDAFELWCWRRLLRVPWAAKRSNQSILEEINPDCSLEGLVLKLKFQYCGYLMWRIDSLEKTLMLGKIEGKRRRGQQRMRWLDCITDSFNAHTVAVFQSPRSVWLFATPWTAARQASLPRSLTQFTQVHVHWIGDAGQPSHPSASLANSKWWQNRGLGGQGEYSTSESSQWQNWGGKLKSLWCSRKQLYHSSWDPKGCLSPLQVYTHTCSCLHPTCHFYYEITKTDI